MTSVTLKTARAGISCVLGVTLAVLFLSNALFAQGNFGRILGTVTDQTGAVLPGAVVTVMDTERGIARTLVTDQAGEYNAPNLIPGTYAVRVEMRGFKRLDRPNIVLEVGREIRVDLTPQPGEQSQVVTVEATAPGLKPDSAFGFSERLNSWMASMGRIVAPSVNGLGMLAIGRRSWKLALKMPSTNQTLSSGRTLLVL